VSEGTVTAHVYSGPAGRTVTARVYSGPARRNYVEFHVRDF